MALNVRYFITDASGNYIDWSHKLKQFSVQGKEIVFIGGAGDDVLYVEAGSSANATDLQNGNDSIYLTGNLSEYVQSINHEAGVYTLTRGVSEVIKFTVGIENDVIYFADGHFVLNAANNSNLYDPANALAPFQQLDYAWMTLDQTVYPVATTPTSASGPALIFVEDATGVDLPMLPQAGQAAIVHGGAGVDKVYVNTGTDVDATDLQTGDDHIYFMHNLEEYTQAIDQESGVYTLTRLDNVSGKTERVKFTVGVEDDVVHFANGSIVINAANDTRIYDPNLAAPFQPLRFDWLNPADPTPLPLITPVINLVAGDDIISASEQASIISGTADANVTVNLTLGAGNVRTVTTNGSGIWNYTLVAADIVAMGEGAETISATAADGFGNVSTAGQRNITIDTTAPAAPVINPIASNDIVNSSEMLAGITITGTGEIGATVTLTFSSGTILAGGNTALVDGAGNWSVALTPFDMDAMLQNSEIVTAKQTDVANNVSGNIDRPFIIDTIAPTATTFSPVDNLSSASPNANLVVTFNENVFAGGGNVRIVNDTDNTTTTIAIGSPEVSIIGNKLTINPTADLVQGKAYHIEIDSGALVDGAGNAYTGIAIGDNATWNFGIGDPSISIDPIATDDKVNALENTGVITVSGKVFSSVVPVLTDLLASDITVMFTPQGGGAPISVTVTGYNNTTGVWSGTIPANTFDPAFTAVTNKIYDVAASFAGSSGNATGYSASTTSLVTVDTTAPAAPVINPIASNDIVNSSEMLAGITITGTGEIGATVTLTFSSGTILAGGNTALVDGAGNWSVALTPFDMDAMGQSAEAVIAMQTDIANNVSNFTDRLFTIDAIAPTATISMSDTALKVGDTSTVTITFSEAVTAFNSNDDVTVQNGALSLMTTANGGITWVGTFTPASIEDSSNVISLATTYTDLAGNTGTIASSANYAVDTLAPIAPSAPDLATIDDTGTSSTDNQTTQTSGLTFTGTAETGATVTLFSDVDNDGVEDAGELLGNVVATGGTYSIDAALAVSATPYNICAIATDVAGNLGAASAVTSTRIYQNVVELSAVAAGNGGFVINGAAINDFSGVQVSNVGDMNGDGYDDVIIGATDFQFGSAYAGQAYVVFGKADTVKVDLSDVANGVGGFRIYSSNASAGQLGQSVSAAGDVNGDGLADVIIGSPTRDHEAGYGYVDTGVSFVVYGKTSTAAVDVALIAGGTNGEGFAINGWEVEAASGGNVSAAGDVNGDGYADLIIGEPNGDASGVLNSGRSYVVFGKQNNVNIELSAIENNIGNSGFVIHGLAQEGMTSGNWVSAAGDVNNDGLSDLLVGAWFQDTMAGADAGGVYVVFGKTGSAPVELSNIWNLNGVGGFAIRGLEAGALLGRSVAAAGDVNGDGYADIIIGERDGNGGGLADVGRSYVVFGKADGVLVNTTDIQAGIGGFIINGANAGDWAGVSVSGAGDFNGDGLDDFIIGAHTADPAAGDMAGVSYLVYGKTGTDAINLLDVALGNGGFIINGQGAGDLSGHSVSAAGDINGDGLADLIVGALYSDPLAGSNAGRSYVIFGGTQGVSAVDQMGTTGNDILAGTAAGETIIGGAGNDIITGNGGTDVLYGGMGNDTFVLNSSNIMALQTGVTSGQLARIDGGNGIDTKANPTQASFDTIKLDGGGILFDLTAITNLAAGNPDGGSRIESIERIDLTGSGNNTLTLAVKDVVDMSGMNVFNNFNGWDDGSYDLAAGGASGINPEQHHQIVVDGDAGDTLLSSGWGASVGTVTNTVGGITNTYTIYNATGVAAQMLVDSEVQVVDTTIITSVYSNVVYDATANTITLYGTGFDTMLNAPASEYGVTNIADNMDWSKLSWDFNAMSSGTDATFMRTDISSAKINSATEMVITLNSTKASNIEANVDYMTKGSKVYDDLNIAAGFSRNAAGNTATDDANSLGVGIDLGVYGNLIFPVIVEGKNYYHWDLSGDGSNANVQGGGSNYASDLMAHNFLDNLFNYDINGVRNTSVANADGQFGTTNGYRYGTLNGIQLALPTYGSTLDGSANANNFTTTNTGANGESTSPTYNPTYNDLLAIWDAFATTSDFGRPSGWRVGNWSATPSSSGHASVYLDSGIVGNLADSIEQYAVLQVL